MTGRKAYPPPTPFENGWDPIWKACLVPPVKEVIPSGVSHARVKGWVEHTDLSGEYSLSHDESTGVSRSALVFLLDGVVVGVTECLTIPPYLRHFSG
jgi:hypothetical protein